MNKILCNSVEYIFLSEIYSFGSDGTPVLKSDAEWKKIDRLIDRPTYSSSVSQTDAGSLKEESISVRAWYNENEILLSLSHLYVVLRLKTNSKTFLIGSGEYPVKAELTENQIEITYSFKRNSEG